MSNKCYEQPDKLFGMYRGIVKKHLENGVLKVFVPGVFPEQWSTQPDMLPDAEMVVPIFGGNNNGNGVFSYPNIGAVVVCQFLNGDQNLPIVIGATQGGNMAATSYHEVANELDPSTGKQPSCIHMVQVGRSKVKIYEGGTIEMRVDGKDGKSSSLTLDQRGNVIINCDGSFQVKANNVRTDAKQQIAQYSGGTNIIASSGTTTINAKDVDCFCLKGVFSWWSKIKSGVM